MQSNVYSIILAYQRLQRLTMQTPWPVKVLQVQWRTGILGRSSWNWREGAREGEQETVKGDFPGHPSCLGWNSTFEISPSHCQPLQIYQKLRSVDTKANHHHPNILGSGRWQDTLGTGVHGCNWQDERAHQSFPKCWGCEHFWGHRFLRMENCVTIKQNMTKGGQTSLQCTFQNKIHMRYGIFMLITL